MIYHFVLKMNKSIHSTLLNENYVLLIFFIYVNIQIEFIALK